MGCGVSKIDPTGATTLPAKLRPIFLRRLEEIKKRRHAQPLKDSTPSKKELLLHDRDEEDNASHFSSSEYATLKNVQSPTKDSSNPSKNEPSSTRYSQNSAGKFESLKGKDPTKPTEKASKESEVATCDDNKCNRKDEMPIECLKTKATNEPNEHETKGDKTKIEGKIANIRTDRHGNEDEDGKHDKERMISHQDDDAFPGSPSFRIYFTDGMDDDQIDNIQKNDALRDTDLNDDKTSIKVGGNLEITEKKEGSTIKLYKELPVKKEAKRGRKIQSFRKVLPKGGQSTVKNLFNVKSCYNPSHSARDRAHLLAAKTV